MGYIEPRVKRPAVPHALRSTFRSWAAENDYDRGMAEIQLAHTVGSSAKTLIFKSSKLLLSGDKGSIKLKIRGTPAAWSGK